MPSAGRPVWRMGVYCQLINVEGKVTRELNAGSGVEMCISSGASERRRIYLYSYVEKKWSNWSLGTKLEWFEVLP